MKSKSTAGLLALFLGGLGIHKFYLGKGGWGILYLLFCWTFIPLVVSFIEAILLFTQSEDTFNAKYNLAYMAATRMAAPLVSQPPVSVNISTTDFQGRQKTTNINADGWTKFTTTVAGFQYHDGPHVVAQLIPGTRLMLDREHTNQYDTNAVRVSLADNFLGYIPRDDAEQVADVMDDGKQVTALIKAYDPDETDYQRLTIEVRRVK